VDAAAIVEQLRFGHGMPEAAVRAAAERPAETVPVLVAPLEERSAALEAGDDDADGRLFALFHLLGSLRATQSYRPLCRLLRLPNVGDALGDSTTETAHRVMAAVFDGDPAPLMSVIEDADADEFVRSRMLEALAMMTRAGAVPRDDAEQYLRDAFVQLQPQACNFVWNGWENAVAMLGLSELSPLVKQAFTRGFIDPTWMKYKHFEEDLAAWSAHPDGPTERDAEEYSLFGDFVEEMSGWPAFSPEPETAADEASVDLDEALGWHEGVPAHNPFRHVSRNDPCPCGSGKKFKRCCLA
jgi:hypothetical protein